MTPGLCELCGIWFNSRSELESHKKKVHDQSHKLTVPVLYKCEKCPKNFKNKALLNKHNNTHSDERYSCKDKECDKTFKRKYDAENHHKQKRFSCRVCQLSFSSMFNKNRHEKTTSCNLQANQDTKFKCKICVKGFSRHDNLTFHMKTVHDKNT